MPFGFGYGYGYGGAWMWGFPVLMVVLMVLGALFLVTVWRGSDRHRPHGRGRAEDPVDLLRRRYAAGEIDAAQYEEMKTRLMDGSD